MSTVKLFATKQVRSVWDAERELWFFSIVDVITVFADSVDANSHLRKLKQRLKAEGNETVTNCHSLKMQAVDGKMRLTDVADIIGINGAGKSILLKMITGTTQPTIGSVNITGRVAALLCLFGMRLFRKHESGMMGGYNGRS